MKVLIAIVFLAIAAMLLAGCASVPKPPAPPAPMVLSDKARVACAAEGGCALVTQRWVDGMLQRAFGAGVEAGEKRRSAL
jgi:uncharacterized lipoprotein YbaY